MKASALVENVRPITIGGQHLHLLPLNAQADLDPPKTLRVQSGRAGQKYDVTLSEKYLFTQFD